MPDRFALPDDRRAACDGCGAERHEFISECWNCEAAVCSHCAVEDKLSEGTLCRTCALARLNRDLRPLVPTCFCSELANDESVNVAWPASVPYGHQLELEGAKQYGNKEVA